ncbi:MAG: phosphatase PAP2 family protein [Lachnospiraceae bacterium]|nr:phosphatase PAP2 family protein [Lachnospiraceae bacterium]
MDIQYLLWLQNFRNSIHDAWTPFMEWVSMFAVTFLIMIPVFYYWTVNKRKGLYVLVSYFFCMVFTPLTKLTACIYRPWIRDARVLPAGDAITSATGYSFPSGHTSTAGPLAGGMAVVLWEDKKTRWLSVIGVAFVFLTGFSRNYLGVHTPQDVFVGITISVLSLILTAKLFAYLDIHPEMEDKLLIGGFIFICISLIYISVKPYPMELNGNGDLIVDPQKMMNDGFGDLGKMMGFIIARFVEKRWIRFKPTGLNGKGIALGLVGLVGLWLLKTYLNPVIVGALGSHWGKLLFSVIYTFYYIALFPLILKLCTGGERS